jgi:hypothetical protein
MILFVFSSDFVYSVPFHTPKRESAMKKLILLCILSISLVLLPGCSSLRIENVDYGWPVESELTVSDDNMIVEGRYIVSCNISKVASEEFQDSTSLRGTKIRLLRNNEGYYFLTGPRFKNVYVFKPGAGTLSLNSKIEVSKSGLKNPALNQRPPYVELLDDDTPLRLLTDDDIVEGKKQ